MSFIFAISPTSVLAGKKFVVVVADTGLDVKDPRFTPYLCKTGHRDFTGDGIEDRNGHGTHVVGIITMNARKKNYCIVVLKIFGSKPNVIDGEKRALKYIETVTPDYVNFSFGDKDIVPEEADTIRKLSNTIFVVAAGNDGKNLRDWNYNYYPAQLYYPNIVTVGNLETEGNRNSTSNYGKPGMAWELGTRILSTVPYSVDPMGLRVMTGTSMASPKYLSRLLNEK